ncbi:MAG: radical SAM protein [Rhodospirillaceae bacterium]|jgi:anaerobic magnesium-protoporphyrin IX monomethyl ester cyclase|nr:radical SAM protein [Rhodospirillaceae bacterium]
MKVCFPVIGWESISVEYLSGHLKSHGHSCEVAYDQCLFDDKNYVSIPFLYRIFNNSSAVVEQVIASKPDIICFSVMSVMYTWARNLAIVLKEELPDVPIVFGGYHPTGAPGQVIAEPYVDYVVVGEGEIALASICEAVAGGEPANDISGVWYKDDSGQVIEMGRAQPVIDPDTLPYVDKEIFERHVPLKSYYLSSLARGCVYNCTYCAVTLLNDISREFGLKQFRLHGVKRVVDELEVQINKYGSKWIDFRHAIFATNAEWIFLFCEDYKKRVNKPFRIFMHPALIREDTTRALKDAGCFTIQVGLESFDEELRREALNRRESNEVIMRAIDAMESAGISYTLDYILGLPGQSEQELKDVLDLFSKLKHCYRLSPFMCQYLPGSEMVDYAKERGYLTDADIENINNGEHDNYMAEGSIGVYSKEWQKTLRMYRLIFRTFGLIPAGARRFVIRTNMHRMFRFLPQGLTLKFLDLLIACSDLDARSYLKNYVWWISRRLMPSHPTYLFRRSEIGKKYRHLDLLSDAPATSEVRCRAGFDMEGAVPKPVASPAEANSSV